MCRVVRCIHIYFELLTEQLAILVERPSLLFQLQQLQLLILKLMTISHTTKEVFHFEH